MVLNFYLLWNYINQFDSYLSLFEITIRYGKQKKIKTTLAGRIINRNKFKPQRIHVLYVCYNIIFKELQVGWHKLFSFHSSPLFPPLSALFIWIFSSSLAVCKGNNSGITHSRLRTILQCLSLRDMKLDNWFLEEKLNWLNFNQVKNSLN